VEGGKAGGIAGGQCDTITASACHMNKTHSCSLCFENTTREFDQVEGGKAGGIAGV
jgi:hypothetical protein